MLVTRVPRIQTLATNPPHLPRAPKRFRETVPATQFAIQLFFQRLFFEGAPLAVSRRVLPYIQRPHESSAEASCQIPALLSPRTTTIMSRPGRVPLAIKQWPAASVYPVFMPLQYGKRFRTLLVFSSSRVRPFANRKTSVRRQTIDRIVGLAYAALAIIERSRAVEY